MLVLLLLNVCPRHFKGCLRVIKIVDFYSFWTKSKRNFSNCMLEKLVYLLVNMMAVASSLEKINMIVHTGDITGKQLCRVS